MRDLWGNPERFHAPNGRQREREREVKETLLCLVTSSDSIVVTNVKVSKRRQSLGKLDRFVPRHVER